MGHLVCVISEKQRKAEMRTDALSVFGFLAAKSVTVPLCK